MQLTGRCWVKIFCCCGRMILAACCCCCCAMDIAVVLRSVTGGGARVCIWPIRFWGIGCVGSWTIRAACCCCNNCCCWFCCCCWIGVTRASREGTFIPLGKLDGGTGSSVWRLGGNIVGPRLITLGCTSDKGTELMCEVWPPIVCCWGSGFRFEGGPGSWL